MALPFTILLLEFGGKERPRSYLLDPAMIPRVSECEHLRKDRSIQVAGKSFAGLCVYSGAVLHFDEERSKLEQQLDQTATYLAKYLIWLRARQLYRQSGATLQLVRTRRPESKITTTEIARHSDLRWDGIGPELAPPQVRVRTSPQSSPKRNVGAGAANPMATVAGRGRPPMFRKRIGTGFRVS